MVSITAVFLHSSLLYTETQATFVVNTFATLNFGLALVGGLVSDHWLGKFRTILVGLVLATGGMLLLLLSTTVLPHVTSDGVGSASSLDSQRVNTIAALLMIASGNGLCTPTLSTFIAEQFAGDKAQIATLYRTFYMTFNLGSIISTVGAPALRQYVSISTAFACLVVGMIIAVMVFAAGQVWYVRPEDRPATSFFGALCCGCQGCFVNDAKRSAEVEAIVEPDLTPRERRKALWRIVKIFLPFPIFWALFFSIYGLWTFSALHMDRRVSSSYTIPPGQVQALNPIIDVLLIPVFDRVIYPWAARMRGGRPLRAIARMSIVRCCTSRRVPKGYSDSLRVGLCVIALCRAWV